MVSLGKVLDPDPCSQGASKEYSLDHMLRSCTPASHDASLNAMFCDRKFDLLNILVQVFFIS